MERVCHDALKIRALHNLALLLRLSQLIVGLLPLLVQRLALLNPRVQVSDYIRAKRCHQSLLVGFKDDGAFNLEFHDVLLVSLLELCKGHSLLGIVRAQSLLLISHFF